MLVPQVSPANNYQHRSSTSPVSHAPDTSPSPPFETMHTFSPPPANPYNNAMANILAAMQEQLPVNQMMMHGEYPGPANGFGCMPGVLTEELLAAQQLALQQQIQNYMELVHCGAKEGFTMAAPMKGIDLSGNGGGGGGDAQAKAAAQLFQVGINNSVTNRISSFRFNH